MGPSTAERVYSNLGNAPLLDLLNNKYTRILDVGCGAGDNAALIKAKNPECEIFGITHSPAEAAIAEAHMARCWVADVEDELPDDIANQLFDVLIFSHVLEHLRDPATVLARFSRLLSKGGQVLIAVPNVLSWWMRVQFLRGDFQYQSSGVLDDTHLDFYTYVTADKHLLSKASDLQLTHKVVEGSVPLWVLRRHIFPRGVSRHIDQFGCRHWPNLFGWQVLLRAIKQ
jgi:2-polyprenyl-3-methyl-5-hydroxy-6-metoxy-1,4-benzoquinol methylase